MATQGKQKAKASAWWILIYGKKNKCGKMEKDASWSLWRPSENTEAAATLTSHGWDKTLAMLQGKYWWPKLVMDHKNI